MTTVVMKELPRVVDPYQRESLLSFEQERVYIARLQHGYDPDAHEHLVRANIGWIGALAAKFCHQGVEIEDLVQEGCLALLKAARQFDLTSDTRLSTFATWKLRRAMQRYIENHGMLIRLPTYQHTLMRRLRHEEVCTDFSPEHIEDVRRAMCPVRSLDQPELGESGDLSLLDVVSEDDATEEAALNTVQQQEVYAALGNVLTERERRILALRFGLGNEYEHTLEEVGRRVRLTRERVRQIEMVALGKVRTSLLAQSHSEQEEQ